MDFKLMARRLVERCDSRFSLRLFRDLQFSDVEGLVSNIGNVSFLKQVKNELRKIDMDSIERKHIKHLLNSKINMLAV